MDKQSRRKLEQYRGTEAGPVENTLIDEFLAGEMDRHTFLRRASMFGLSTSIIGTTLLAGGEAPLAFAGTERGKAGGRARCAIIPPPVSEIEPHTFKDQGGLETGSICGEHLTRASLGLKIKPELAISWTPNKDASVWRVKLRPNVMFQTGQPMSADDIVTTYERLVSPNTGSQALSVFQGVLSPGGTKKVDNLTVDFHLDAPYAAFPYAISSTTYTGIILPANYQIGTFTTKPQTTGAFKLTSYTPGVGAKYDRFDGWWGGHAALDGVDVTYFTDPSAADAALLGGNTDLIGQIQLASDRALFNNPNVQIFAAPGATHREVCMRADLHNPLRDWRVRQAIALTLDRPAIVARLFSKYAVVGNDSPFAPVYPSSVGPPQVPQRRKNIPKAKQLMAAAGHAKGFSITLTTEATGEIPQLAQIIQQSVKAIGIKMSLKILTATQYFAGSQSGPPTGWGNTPWLNAPMNITDWGHRAVPNVYLTAAFETKGIWNAAHYSSKKFDAAAKSYIAAIALKDQRKYAKVCEQILLHDTPVIFPYFYSYLAAGSPRLKGYVADPQGTVWFSHASLA
jgi:peptide/nickel transport system substrate-binding protein